MSRDILVFAVSGFLGQASDWSEVQKKLKATIFLNGVNLFSPRNNDNLSFIDAILAEVEKHSSDSRNVFLGYSFGGRLGLKLMQLNPNLFERWIFVSTGLGFPDNALVERKQRLESDHQWAQQITPEAWPQFIHNWNNQAIFAHSKEPHRKLEDYSLVKLQKALQEESLALQPDFRQLIKSNKEKIFWLTGRFDSKYLMQAEKMLADGCIEESFVLNGGHRLTHDAPEQIAEILNARLL